MTCCHQYLDAVNLIPEDWMADMSQVYPDLHNHFQASQVVLDL